METLVLEMDIAVTQLRGLVPATVCRAQSPDSGKEMLAIHVYGDILGCHVTFHVPACLVIVSVVATVCAVWAGLLLGNAPAIKMQSTDFGKAVPVMSARMATGALVVGSNAIPAIMEGNVWGALLEQENVIVLQTLLVRSAIYSVREICRDVCVAVPMASVMMVPEALACAVATVVMLVTFVTNAAMASMTQLVQVAVLAHMAWTRTLE